MIAINKFQYKIIYLDKNLSIDQNNYFSKRQQKFLINFVKKEIMISMVQTEELIIFSIFNHIMEKPIEEMKVIQLDNFGSVILQYFFKNVKTNDITLNLSIADPGFSNFELVFSYENVIII